MIIALSAEPYTEGLTDYSNDNRPIDLSETNLSELTKDKMNKWYNEYQKYVALTLKELEPYRQEIEKLDRQGVELLKQIGNELQSEKIEKYYYLSFIRDDFSYVLYPDGNGKQL